MNTREKLTSSALKLFSEKGFEATSTNSICKDAGFSSGALFVYFSSKNELLDTIYFDIKKEYFVAAQKDIDMTAGVIDIFRQGIFQGAQYYVQNPDKFIFMKRFLNSPHIGRITLEAIQQESQLAFDLFEKGKAEGTIKDMDNSLIEILITNATYGYIEYCLDNKSSVSLGDIDDILDMIVNS